MSRGLWLAAGAAVGIGAIVVATRAARASTSPRAIATSPRAELPAEIPPTSNGAAGGPAVEPPAPTMPARVGSRLSPLIRARVSPNGGFRAIRTKGHGSCRRGNYPCTHWGVDLVPESYYRGPIVEAEWWVRAPEDLVVDLVALDDESPPLSGYGPGAVLARGHSGAWHVFGHLSPRTLATLKPGDAIRAGVFFARLASGVRPPHVHWEPRRWRTEGPAARALGRKVGRGDIVIDPDLWLREAA